MTSVVIDAGLRNFAHEQIYVALSRVTSLQGLHLVNYDPSSVTADKRAILQYNSLRRKFRPDLLQYAIPVVPTRDRNYVEQSWTVPRGALQAQDCREPLDDLANIQGLPNEDNSSFAIVSLQLIALNKTLREQILKLPNDHILKVTVMNYINKRVSSLSEFRLFVGHEYTMLNTKVDIVNFIQALIRKCDLLRDMTVFQGVNMKHCCSCQNKSMEQFSANVLNLSVKNDGKLTYNFKDLMDFKRNMKKIHTMCDQCKSITEHFVQLDVKATTKFIIAKIDLEMSENPKTLIYSNCKIKSVPSTIINIHKRSYKVQSAIFFEGSTTSGNYSIMGKDKNNSWVYIRDDHLIEKKKWPTNAKNAHILLLEEK